MTTKRGNQLGIILAIVAIAGALAVGGCTEKITGTAPNAGVEVDIGQMASASYEYRLTVTSADMDTIVAYADTVVGNRLVFAVEVPNGQARQFVADALDNQGNVIYSGAVTEDVSAQVLVDLQIDMQPVGPMVYVIPLFKTAPFGTEFALTVCAGNLPGLEVVGMGLNLSRSDAGNKGFQPVFIDTVLLDPEQEALGSILTYQHISPGEITFDVSREGALVDEDGNARLITVHCRTEDLWSPTPVLLTALLYYEYFSGIELPGDQVHLDPAELLLYRDRVPEFYLDHGGSEIGMNLVPTNDGDVMLGGSFAPSDVDVIQNQLLMVPLDSGVNPAPPRIVPWADRNTTRELVSTPGGDFFAVASGAQISAGEVVRLSAAGDVIWRKESQIWGGYFAVAARPGEGCIVAGNWANDGRHLLLVSYDALAAADNTAYFQPSDFSSDQSFTAVLAIDDTTFVAAGLERPFGGWADTVVLGQYIQHDLDIVPRWQKRFPASGDGTVKDLLLTDDGGFLIVGSSTASSGIPGDARLIRTTADGDLMWDRAFGQGDDDRAMAAAPAGDGGFVVTGSSGPMGGTRDVLLFKVSGGGDLVWKRLHGGPNDEIGFDVIRSGDGFLATGTVDIGPTGDRDALVLRLDAMGR